MTSWQPGWYHAENDPPATLRWYDGTAWTEHVTDDQPTNEHVAGEATHGWPAAVTSATQTLSQTAIMQRLAPASRTAPPEVWLAALAMFLSGALLLYPALRYGYLGIEVMVEGGGFGRALGALILMVLTIIGALGIALLLLAVGLLRASRVAQILTFVVCGITALSVLSVSGDGLIGGGVVAIVLLALVGVCAAVGLRPAVREWFARDERPMGVAVAATANAYFGWVLVLDGILFLLAATVAARFAVAGVLMLAAAVVLITSTRPLRSGSREARTRTLVAYGVIAVGLIILLSDGGSAVGILVPLCALVGGTVGLTVPESSKRHFGTAPAAPLTAPEV